MPQAGSKNLWKTLIFDDSIALFKFFFEVPGGRKSTKKWSENSIHQKLGWESVLGGSWGPVGGHFGSQNRSRNGSENEPDFGSIFKTPKRATRPCDGGSPGLGPDRRGGVGEGV